LRLAPLAVRYADVSRRGGLALLGYSTTVYNWLKLVHVLAAVIWVGGDVMILIMSVKVLKEADPHREAAFVHDIGQIGKRIIGPSQGC
jgi:hypothetical protein